MRVELVHRDDVIYAQARISMFFATPQCKGVVDHTYLSYCLNKFDRSYEWGVVAFHDDDWQTYSRLLASHPTPKTRAIPTNLTSMFYDLGNYKREKERADRLLREKKDKGEDYRAELEDSSFADGFTLGYAYCLIGLLGETIGVRVMGEVTRLIMEEEERGNHDAS